MLYEYGASPPEAFTTILPVAPLLQLPVMVSVELIFTFKVSPYSIIVGIPEAKAKPAINTFLLAKGVVGVTVRGEKPMALFRLPCGATSMLQLVPPFVVVNITLLPTT